MKKLKLVALFSSIILFFNFNVRAEQSFQGIIDGETGKQLSLNEALGQIPRGTIIFIGENHGFKTHQQQQLEIIKGLQSLGHQVLLGMEFFSYTQQNLVNLYTQGAISETEFLKAIAWGQPSFDFYRDQVFQVVAKGGSVWALNAPRSLTGKVAKSGLVSLDAAEMKLLPPQFKLGRDSYKDRFYSLMPHLPSLEAAERYFAAQSIWDDTMAWRLSEIVKLNPGKTVVVIVGEFHVAFGGGLPNRTLDRSKDTSVMSISQLNTKNMSHEEFRKAVEKDLKTGEVRAEFIWAADAE